MTMAVPSSMVQRKCCLTEEGAESANCLVVAPDKIGSMGTAGYYSIVGCLLAVDI